MVMRFNESVAERFMTGNCHVWFGGQLTVRIQVFWQLTYLGSFSYPLSVIIHTPVQVHLQVALPHHGPHG